MAIWFMLAAILAIGIYLWFFSTPTRGLNVKVQGSHLIASNARLLSNVCAKKLA